MKLAMLLPRLADSKISTADLLFLRPPGSRPFAAAALPLPRVLGSQQMRTAADWAGWLRGCHSWLRAGGWCQLNHPPIVQGEVRTRHLAPLPAFLPSSRRRKAAPCPPPSSCF